MIDLTEDKINILYLVDQIERTTGGSEQHLSFLLKHLPRDRFCVFLALLRRRSDLDRAELPIEPIYLRLRSFYRPNEVIRAAHKLARFIEGEQIDIVHTFFANSELLGVIAKAMNKSLCLVSARRSMGYWHTPSTLLKSRLVSRVIPHFIANCEAVKQRISEIENISLDKIQVIYNPVNRARIRDGFLENISRSNLGIKNGVPVIGMVANFRPVKDYACFLRASRIIADKEPNAKFIIVGSGEREFKERLHNRISDLDLHNCVMNLGEQRNPIPLIRLFDVGVLTSKSEGLSNALIEYGALGVPTVATDVGGNAEILKDGVSGFLVPPSSPEALARRVLELLEKGELRQRFGIEAEKHVLKKFSEEAIIFAYDKCYRKILGVSQKKERIEKKFR
jgi:glycosyltransferase involved in cell wall biosynthesis